MAAARVEPALGGGWVLCIPLPGGGEERLVFAEHDQAEQGFALLGLHTALQAGNVAEVQRLVDVVQADDESIAELRELSLPELIQMLRLSLEEAAAAGEGEPPPPASDNNATPSQNAHGTMLSMNSTAAGAQSPREDAAAPTAAVKQEPLPLIKTEEGQVGQPAGGGGAAAAVAAFAAAGAAPAAADGPAEPMQLDEQPWDGMDVDDDVAGSDYPGVTRVPPSSGSGSATTLGWQVALLTRLDAAGSPAADAEPTEQLFRTATELEAALASDLAQLWQEQHCGPQSFGAFGREGHFNQSWFNHSVASYSLDAPLWAALAQLSTFSEFQTYLLQLQACGFLAVAAQTYSELQLPAEPWPDPKLASGCSTAVQPNRSPAQGAGGGGSAAGGRMRKEAWQPLAAEPAPSQQQPAGQPAAGEQQAPAGEQQQLPQHAAPPGGTPKSRAAKGVSASGGGSSADERLLRATHFSGLAYIQQMGKWRAIILVPMQAGEPCKKPIILSHQQPMVVAAARDLAVFWRLDILQQQGDGRAAPLPPAVLHDRYAADAQLVRQLTAATTVDQLRALLRKLRDGGTLTQLASKLRQALQQQLAEEQPLPPRQLRRRPRQPPQAQQQQRKQQQPQQEHQGGRQPVHLSAEQPQQPQPQQQQAQQPDVPAQQAGGRQDDAAAQQLLRQASLQRKREAVQERLDRLRDQAAQEAEQDGEPLQQGSPLPAEPAEQGQPPARPAELGHAQAQPEEGQQQVPAQGQAQGAQQPQQTEQQPGDGREQQVQAVQQQNGERLSGAPVQQPAPAVVQPLADRQESSQSLQLFFQNKSEQPPPPPQQQQQQGGSQPQQAQPASEAPPRQQQEGGAAAPAGRSPSRPPGNHPGSRGGVRQDQQLRPRQHGHQHQQAHQRHPHHAKQAWHKEQQRLQRWTGGPPAGAASRHGDMQGWPQGSMVAQPLPVFVPGPVLVPMDAALVSMAAQQCQQQQFAALAAHQQAAGAAWPQQMAAAPHLAAADMQAQAAMYSAHQQQQQQAAAAMQAAAGMHSYGSGPMMLAPYGSGWPGPPGA